MIGIGNEYRSDDGAGVVVARRIRKRAPSSCVVCETGGEGTALMELWRHADDVILIDAVSSGAAPGTIHTFHPSGQPLPTEPVLFSSHAFGLVQAIEISRVLNELPRQMIIYGIEGENFEMGTELSPAVQESLNDAVDKALTHISTVQQTILSSPCSDVLT